MATLVGTPFKAAIVATVLTAALNATLPVGVRAYFSLTGVEQGSCRRFLIGQYAPWAVYVALLVVPWYVFETVTGGSPGVLGFVASALPAVTFVLLSQPGYGVLREAYLDFDAAESAHEDWTEAYAAGDLL